MKSFPQYFSIALGSFPVMTTLMSCFLLACYPTGASAYTFGNTINMIEENSFYTGINVSKMKRDFEYEGKISASNGYYNVAGSEQLELIHTAAMFGIKMNESVIMEVSFGEMTIKHEDDEEIKADVLGGTFRFFDFWVVSLLSGSFDTDDANGDIQQIETGVIFSRELRNSFSVFGGLMASGMRFEETANTKMLSELSASLSSEFTYPVKAFSATLTHKEEDIVGFLVGAGYTYNNIIRTEIEFHSVYESGLGLRLAALF